MKDKLKKNSTTKGKCLFINIQLKNGRQQTTSK